MSNVATLTFYPLWLTLVGCLALASPLAAGAALLLGLAAMVGTRTRQSA
ncbi:hypothetical protein AB0F15_00290 [Amycolatopsis sp. NPDC026612]